MKLVGFLALAGFLAALAAHLSTFAGADWIADYPWIMGLHVGIFVVFVPAVISMNVRGLSVDDTLARLPRAAKILLAAVVAYVVVNFVVSIRVVPNGSVFQEGDRYYLREKGTPTREISAAEFHENHAHVLRLFSGHWMAFYLFPALLFLAYRHEAPVSRDVASEAVG